MREFGLPLNELNLVFTLYETLYSLSPSPAPDFIAPAPSSLPDLATMTILKLFQEFP